jgi:hypothetical protein
LSFKLKASNVKYCKEKSKMALHVRVIRVRANHVMEAKQMNESILLASRIGQGLVLAGHK